MAKVIVNTETRNVHDLDCPWLNGCWEAGGLTHDNYVIVTVDIAQKLVGGSFENHICSYCSPDVMAVA